MSEQTFVIGQLSTLRPRMLEAFRACEALLRAGLAVEVSVRERKTKRTSAQNDRLQAMCRDVADQVEWHGQRLSQDDWRHIFVAAYRREQRIVPGIAGGFVVLGESSRRLSVSECGDVMELVASFGSERGVVFRSAES